MDARGELDLLRWHGAAVLTCLIVLSCAGKRNDNLAPEEQIQLSTFKRQYLPAYLLATFCDWIQGPYQFKVYLTYGLTEEQIGRLYVAGFGSSLTLGTYVASLADSRGRKMGCFWYCITCALSCLTKNSSSFTVLLLGRVLGGVAASLLFSTFESWCVTEARRKGLPSNCLASLFTTASFLNGLVAIIASLFGHALVVLSSGDVVTPFNAVPLILVACASIMFYKWDENYGEREADGTGTSTLAQGLSFMFSEPKLPLLGLIGSLFDAALYIFIFLWTLSLEKRSADPTSIPYGIAFALFMGWCMIGALMCQLFLSSTQNSVTLNAARLLMLLLLLACTGLWPCLSPYSSYSAVFNGFCLLEFAFGAYSPVIALLRACHLDDKHRTSVTALYRTPTNLSVCLVLFYAGSIPEAMEIGLCILLLVTAFLANVMFLYVGGGTVKEEPNAVEQVEEPLKSREKVKARSPQGNMVEV